MLQMNSIITILTLISTYCSESLPVTSKALDNNSDQLIWQSAWYSQRVNEEKKDSPFTGDSRRITAKSIFITPNFNQNASHCPPGFKIDDIGKCIRLVNINQDNILVTRLQNYFSGHQTTDDTTSNDYDYSLEEDDTNEPTQFTLPLIPILNNQDSHLIAIDKSQEDKIELNKFSFSHHSDPGDQKVLSSDPGNQAVLSNDSATTNNTSDELKIDNTSDAFISSTEHDLITNEKNATNEQSKLYESSSIEPETLDQSTTDTIEYETFSDFSYASEMSKEPPSTDLSYDMNEDESYPQTTLSEILTENLEKKPEAGKEMNNSSTETHFDDYFETLFKNESLLIDNTSSYENLTEFDYDTATTTQPSIDHLIEESSGDGRVEKLETATVYEVIRTAVETTSTVANKIKFEDDQNASANDYKESEKFVYRTSENVFPLPSSVIRFPDNRDGVIEKNQRVRFPDDNSGSQWVRDNGYHLMRFWQEQPLIDDDKAGDYEVLHRRNY